MSNFPEIYLARHGETEWSLTGQHTGRTDIPLTERGERNASSLGKLLEGVSFARVWTSPLQRARRTCELAGLGDVAEPDDDLVEWDYGEYEGVRTVDIQKTHPGWNVFHHGCPAGETIDDIAARADRVIERIRQVDGNVILFSHGHFLRVIAARWIQLPPIEASRCMLTTASLSMLGYEHNLDEPVIRHWNDDRHVVEA
ncbi:MAG: histidine phosphatase family protein [Pseudomonadota bacterium]|nr:histidine phosphatase family protein [Pseudomonadota bacterium]